MRGAAAHRARTPRTAAVGAAAPLAMVRMAAQLAKVAGHTAAHTGHTKDVPALLAMVRLAAQLAKVAGHTAAHAGHTKDDPAPSESE